MIINVGRRRKSYVSSSIIFLSGQNGADGKRTTSLTLKGIDDAKFAETYSCSFIYSDSEKYSESVELHVRGIRSIVCLVQFN